MTGPSTTWCNKCGWQICDCFKGAYMPYNARFDLTAKQPTFAEAQDKMQAVLARLDAMLEYRRRLERLAATVPDPERDEPEGFVAEEGMD
jgi:hypothetical protein